MVVKSDNMYGLSISRISFKQFVLLIIVYIRITISTVAESSENRTHSKLTVGLNPILNLCSLNGSVFFGIVLCPLISANVQQTCFCN